MDKLISFEPSNLVAIRIEQGQKCYGMVTMRNVMYTMPVAFRLLPVNKNRYSVRPQTGIIAPLTTFTVEITYHPPPNGFLPDALPYCNDGFQLHSVVAPGAIMVKDHSSSGDTVPNDWFTTRNKQVFLYSGLRIMFVGAPVLAQLVAFGSMDQIREVLEKSDPSWKLVNSVDSDGQTLLHLAIAQCRPDLLQLLLEFEPDIDAQNRSGYSPLESAAAAGEALIAELLLANKASAERSKSSMWGPIHLATGGGHVDVLRLLLLKGAKVDGLTKDGNTALHVAVAERRRDCAKILLARGANADVRNTNDGGTPLHIAATLGDEHMVKLLLHKGANKDVRNSLGKTPYDVAAENGHERLFDALGLGDSLCAAARKGEARTIFRLLENGAAVNGRDQHGWTALHRASFKGKIEVLRALIERGADVDARDEDGYTALHCAVESGHGEVIELLVKRGADVEVTTNKGVNAIQIADSLHYLGIKRILIHGGLTKDGAKLNRVGSTKDGVKQVVESPVGTPLRYGMKERVEELKKNRSRRSSRSHTSSFDQSMTLGVV
ncbi:hypothetical protein Vadar_019884 [Vaccinium darrowii]|uniref:Uncharacterized protein n=1 Tax=Vaccinium darrowii TaxID=229202 RepID=A0ACB7YQ66_9ERIC|nr:hypothetical protein Vadar_019884 [Vaccinium darrowii]